MAKRPRLPKTDVQMQRWCAQLESEISEWPDVSSRPMFGMLAFYRARHIFAALPRTRAAETPFSLLIKLPEGTPPGRSARPEGTPLRRSGRQEVRGDERLSRGGPGASWVTFSMESATDIAEALRWLGRAYERAGGR
ncbi:MAG TPA: hypothetical protein VIX63_01455 [Vicinamibacterales bacterium]